MSLDKCYDAFIKEQKNIFIIIKAGVNVDTLQVDEVCFRKIDDKRISILAWSTRESLESYLDKMPSLKGHLTITEISKKDLITFLNRIGNTSYEDCHLELLA